MIAEPHDVLLGPTAFAPVRLGLLTTVVAGDPGVAFDPIGGSILRSAGLLRAGTWAALGPLGWRVDPVLARRSSGRNRPLRSFCAFCAFSALGAICALGRPDLAVLRASAAGFATFRSRFERAHVLDSAGPALAALGLRLRRAAVLHRLRTRLDGPHRLFS